MENNIEEVTKCMCCDNPGEESHICPYLQDMNGDDESLCNCCLECEGHCKDDI